MCSSDGKKNIIDLLQASAVDNRLPCARVFEICNEISVFPELAGITMDNCNLRITFCQLGLFGYPDGKNIPVCESVPKKLEEEIFSYLENDKLPCAAAWNIAGSMKIKKTDVSAACEKLGIKIGKCQLGAFSDGKRGKC